MWSRGGQHEGHAWFTRLCDEVCWDPPATQDHVCVAEALAQQPAKGIAIAVGVLAGGPTVLTHC